MTKYKAQHGKTLMYRGVRYLDVMRWQKNLQVGAAPSRKTVKRRHGERQRDGETERAGDEQ